MATENRIATLNRFWRALGENASSLDLSGLTSAEVALPSRLATADLAWASVTAAALSASLLSGTTARALTNPRLVALAFQSDRHLRINGKPADVWAPLSGFWQTRDGWVRTHGNYPHHARALRRALKLAPDAAADTLSDTLRELESEQAALQISAAGGLCVVVQAENPESDHALRTRPVVEITRIADASKPRPLRATAETPLCGIRVLDLTRVIAGPVATRTLALMGAEVLRLDPPHLPESDWQHFDTGHGKRSATLDVTAEAARWRKLVATADVVVLGYRAQGLTRLSIDAHTLTQMNPGLVVAQLTAWGSGAADRRGFDSLVQAESGISCIESTDGVRPGALPAQALDHSAGYLLAAGICAALRRRSNEGGSWIVETSLRRIAAELLGMPRSAPPVSRQMASADDDDLQTFNVDGTALTTVRPAVAWPGGPEVFSAPRPWGEDVTAWL